MQPQLPRPRGSPPRMRGKRCVFESLIVCIGITPADAGKTSSFFCQPSGAEDHPRGCGENLVCSSVHNNVHGSPPRMRGKRRVRFLFCLRTGITPADAGKTRYQHCNIGNLLGSPPRMRGKLVGYHYTDGVDRITPADAGKTINQPEAGCLTEDHPRGCGENGGQKKLRPIFKGSPPRMRGKRPTKFLRCGNLRITPADAGKTDFGLSYFVSFQDHPRGCGENRFLYMRRSLYRGSPPRMRGKPEFETLLRAD